MAREDDMNWLFLGKKTRWCADAAGLMSSRFPGRVTTHLGNVGDPFPPLPPHAPIGVLSYLSPWIVPAEILKQAQIAINFHPGSCDYPGIGCYNFALYEEAQRYGAVCHHMAAKVDTGQVIAERLFDVWPEDTVETLKYRTLIAMAQIFDDILTRLGSGQILPLNARQWSRPAFKRNELNALCVITPDMTSIERAKRIRATVYPGAPGPILDLGTDRFHYAVPNRPALA